MIKTLSDSEGSWTDGFEADPDYAGPPYPSQPGDKRRVSYNPPGFKHRWVKQSAVKRPQSFNSSVDVDKVVFEYAGFELHYCCYLSFLMLIEDCISDK